MNTSLYDWIKVLQGKPRQVILAVNVQRFPVFQYFNSLPHIIENHQRTPLVLIDGQNNTKDTTRLSYPVRPHGWNADE